MKSHREVPLPTVGLSGFDASLSEEEQGAQQGMHRFAREVMRPIGRELDRMPAEQAYLPGSPFWRFHGEMMKLGMGPDAMMGMPPDLAARMEGIVVEELAWGDLSLAVAILSPALVALPVSVRIEGPTVQFDSHPERRQWRRFGPGHDDDDDSAEGWGLVRSTADGHRVTFGLASPLPRDRPRIFGWLTLGALLLLTAAAYTVVRRLLRPLDAINAGVARFGSGDFATPIATPRRDELGELAERINTMAGSLHGMLEAKRALLLAISHELRSPLTRARVNAELVAEGEHRDALLRDLSEMRDLITDLLESERLANGHAALQTESVNLPALVRELVATQFAGVPIVLELDDTLPAVQADPMRLKLLLRNLIDNALRHGDNALRHGDHAPHAGTESAAAQQPPVVTLAREGADQVLLRVRDFGLGVSDDGQEIVARDLAFRVFNLVGAAEGVVDPARKLRARVRRVERLIRVRLGRHVGIARNLPA